MSEMDPDGLRTFIAIARLGGFGRAAEALHCSQPAVSRRIELLEAELGAPVFERIRSGALLTDAGISLLPYAEMAMAAVQDGAEAVRGVNAGILGRVSLAMVGTLADARMTRRLTMFRASYPDIQLDLQTATSEGVGDLVLRGEATLGLRYREDLRPGLISKVIDNEALVVVCAEGHRLADGAEYSAADLLGERWVAFPLRPAPEAFAQFLGQRLAQAGISEPEIIPIDSLTAQKRMVEAGFGLALLAERGVEAELQSGGLRVVNVPALRARIPISVIHRRSGYLSPAAQRLSRLLSSETEVADSGNLD